jgi:hypothetical protein
MNLSGGSASAAAMALLLLSACSAGKPAQATPPSATGVASPTAATPTAATPTGVNPTSSGPAAGSSPAAVTRIGPYTLIFATPLPADPAQAKVIQGFEMSQILWNKSEYAWRLVAPVADYVTGQALSGLMAAVNNLKATDVVPAGTDRRFMTSVAALTGTTATVTTCDDGSKYTAENPITGKINPAYSAPANQAYLFEAWHMVLRSGHWALSSVTLAMLPSARARHCQP